MAERDRVREALEERRDRFGRLWEVERSRSLRLGWIRVGTFLAGFSLYVLADVSHGVFATVAWGGVGVALLSFLGEVFWHRRIKAREGRFQALTRVNEEALNRMDRRWASISDSGMDGPPRGHPYAVDLDLSGSGSLFHLFSTITLPPGGRTLREWLLAPAEPWEVRERQGGVEELAHDLELRQTMEATGRMTDPPDQGALESFLTWAEEDPWLLRHPWIRVGAWVLPILSFLLLYLHLRGPLTSPFWLFTLVGSFLVASVHRRAIHPLLDAASGGQDALSRYADLLDLLAGMEAESPVLRALKGAVRSGPLGASQELRRLRRRVGWADVRLSGMAHGALQLLLAWDIHILESLERWRSEAGSHVRGWLHALGRLEALAALAALRFEHPDWTFPRFLEEEEPILRGKGLGHPLLPHGACVRNDLEIGPPGTFLFVTGSNMSGKSTLLRAVGLNTVLAQAGGPVCADRMALSPLRVFTSMRTSDSLKEGVSQYMAELQSIHRVVEGARSQPNALFLLDEPLQGTNEAERRVAVQTILGHLLEAGGIGAVATHDLYLDEKGSLKSASRPVHLEGRVDEGKEGPILSFDYKLRPGRATSTNALALLKAVGLGRE